MRLCSRRHLWSVDRLKSRHQFVWDAWTASKPTITSIVTSVDGHCVVQSVSRWRSTRQSASWHKIVARKWMFRSSMAHIRCTLALALLDVCSSTKQILQMRKSSSSSSLWNTRDVALINGRRIWPALDSSYPSKFYSCIAFLDALILKGVSITKILSDSEV